MALKALDQRVASASPTPQRAANDSAVPPRAGPSSSVSEAVATPPTVYTDSSKDVGDGQSEDR